jgi:hypothetical protein
MSTESMMERLRRANPVTDAPAGDHGDLFTRIIALPGDHRLAESPPSRRTRPRRRIVAVAIVVGVAALLASTAFAISQLIGGDVVPPPVTQQEYLDAQKQLVLPPGASWPKLIIPEPNSVTNRGGGGGHAVITAMTAWECYWADAIRKGDEAAGQRAHDALDSLLAKHVYEAPVGASENWAPSPMPPTPFLVFAHDGGLQWKRAAYEQAAAGHPGNLIQSCRVNR